MNSLPDTPGQLLADCQKVRQRLVDDIRRKPAFLSADTQWYERTYASDIKGWCVLPRLKPFWEAMHVMNKGAVPTFPGEPTSAIEAFAGLAVVMQWCRAAGAVGANDDELRPCYARDHLWLHWQNEGTTRTAAKIRDRWNKEYNEHGGAPIAKGTLGSDVVKKGLKQARLDNQKKN
jgi:hypothetical protein